MTNHAPALWFIDENGDISSKTAGHWVARGLDGIFFKSDADRDLILAAPDMYEALLAVEVALEETSECFLYRQVRDVLKKARGEA